MAFRTTVLAVQKIIDVDPSMDLSPFIEIANELVTEMCAAANPIPGMPATDAQFAPYTAARLEKIERWLAAHFVAIKDPRYSSEGIGAANVSYQSSVGMNLKLTSYGQQAMLLDTKGGLSWLDSHIAAGKRPRVGAIWLGKRNPYSRGYGYRSLGHGEG